MTSDETIREAAWIIHCCTGDEDGAPVAARALAKAGLLAPAPLREEWGYLIGATGYLSVSREAAENAVTRTGRDARLRDGNPRIARILTSDWIECEANDE